jgi:hypothetical protein
MACCLYIVRFVRIPQLCGLELSDPDHGYSAAASLRNAYQMARGTSILK